MQLISYLNFNGQCEEAFKFYEQCLGGQIVTMMTYQEMPSQEPVPEDRKNRIVHATLKLGEAVLMASDCPPEYYHKPQGMNVMLQITDPVQGERIFNALAEGGTVSMPYEQTFWAYRFGMVTDRFGTPWMINCEKAAA